MVAVKDLRMLVEAIEDYNNWAKSTDGQGRSRHGKSYAQALNDFLAFSIKKDLAWKDIFTLETVERFRDYTTIKQPCRALVSLSNYLFVHEKIDQPLQVVPTRPKKHHPLPDIYDKYLLYYEQSHQGSQRHLGSLRTMLASFHEYLENNNIKLPSLNIEHLDTYMAKFKAAHSSIKLYRSNLRGFLRYLYYERRIIQKDLAALLVGPPLYAQTRPPKFLRPQEVKKLFSTLSLSTPSEIRTYAMVHLAYSLGLRPVEVSRITLDDISFEKAQITLRDRKGNNPITLPIAENTIKAIAAYVLNVRPKNPYRHLFLTFDLPNRPVQAATVVHHISKAMKKAGLPSSSYWLRHTYAQNLLHSGRTIYEVKEMMGHDNIQSTQRYLYVNTELMRKVLFDEIL
jgi:integrase/recombinase XerD